MKSIQLFLKQISSSFFLLSSLCSFIIFAENKCIEIYDPSNKLNLGNINSGHFDKKDGEIIFSYDLNTKKFDKLSFIKQQRGNEALIIKRNGVMYSDVRGYQNKIKPEYDARPHLTVLEMEKTIDGIPKNSPILLLGEGTSGTLLKELVEKGFSNLRSIDVLYKALDRNYEKNYSARENGELLI